MYPKQSRGNCLLSQTSVRVISSSSLALNPNFISGSWVLPWREVSYKQRLKLFSASQTKCSDPDQFQRYEIASGNPNWKNKELLFFYLQSIKRLFPRPDTLTKCVLRQVPHLVLLGSGSALCYLFSIPLTELMEYALIGWI